ncbi:hypothetical protein [Thiothrix lacustris]|uniref:hypothetical protein n=1 Tax=Thiothrix lacustris TaxID=525917 RepID=UPI0027E511C3|nr:hypothetical protein [Thiothrix lacustris]WMP15685.1 hypothetical protein RCS87_09785 [Thiothrix lacustris]
MLKHSKSGPLKVALLAISPHNRAILEFFFSGAGRNLFKVVIDTEADAFILDYDHPDAKEDWHKQEALQKPGIILSVHQIDLPLCIWIPKPLTSRALTEAVEKVQELMVTQPAPAGSSSHSVGKLERGDTQAKEIVRESQHFRDLPKPFGIPERADRVDKKLRSLMISLPDDADDEEVVLPLVSVEPTAPTSAPVTVFDPAETNIPLEEIDRPIESTASQAEAELRWKTLCGEQDDVQASSDIALFTPENYLLASVLDALRQAQEVQQTLHLKLSAQHYALLMPKQGLAFCTLDTRSEEFRTLCNNPVQTGQFALHIPDAKELEQMEPPTQGDPNALLLDLEAFVWVSSLLTARGRLGRGVDIEQKIVLKYWPNLTRLEQFPHIMRIAALWNQRPANVLEIAKALNIPQRYVFAFHTAATALNLFEMDQNKLNIREKEKPKQENRGFFSRFLKRLLGGGTN